MDPTLNRLLAHDAWTTNQLLEVCRDVSDADLDRRFEIGPGSVRATFDEIIGAMEHWADRIADRAKRERAGAGVRGSITELTARLDAVAEDLGATAQALCDAGRLDEIMELTYGGTLYRFTRRIALVHVATHGIHHRAQIINMLRHLGVEHDVEGDAITWEIAAGVVPDEP